MPNIWPLFFIRVISYTQRYWIGLKISGDLEGFKRRLPVQFLGHLTTLGTPTSSISAIGAPNPVNFVNFLVW